MNTSDLQERVAAALERPLVHMLGHRAAYVGPGMRLTPHRNAVDTVVIGLEAPFQLRIGPDLEQVQPRDLALIASGSWHHLMTEGPMAFVYLDLPTHGSTRAKGLTNDRGRARAAAEVLRHGPPQSNVLEPLCQLLELPKANVGSERLAVVMQAIAERPSDFGRIEAAADLVGLSVSRFQHLFTEEFGLPFGRYRQWSRMGHVARSIAGGCSLTEAALDAGFSSSAHLSSAFRTMFGIKPSQLISAGTRFRFDPAPIA